MTHEQRRKPTGWIQRLQQSHASSGTLHNLDEPAHTPDASEVQPQTLPRMLPAAEVAAAFAINRRTLTNWEAAGVLMPVRIRTRRYYLATDIEALIRVREH